MTVLNEGRRTAEGLLSEANGDRSRANIVVTGGNFPAGQVLGKITNNGTAVSAAKVGNVGNGAMGAVTVGSGAIAGIYTLTCTAEAANAGTFQLVDPLGRVVGNVTVAVAFNSGGLSFTLADGATDFDINDGFTITVGAGSGAYTDHDPAATDGTEVAAGILYAAVDASAADKDGVAIVRDAEWMRSTLSWLAGTTNAEKVAAEADLAAVGVILR